MTEQRNVPKVIIELWDEGDLGLLRQLNSLEMTVHFGGPETEEKILARHKLGFSFISECDFEYPVGTTIRCNDWRLTVGENI